ncbi:MAG: molybdopterin-dependent oxidoreductase [Thermodesulfobacteriota bacterium]|nr:molybdopterin-dependent oxidoreductase [Thermodesulfobacteriota bacterium]
MEQKPFEIIEDKWVPTTCGMCYGMCAIRVRVVNGVPIEVEGNPESVMAGSNGGICGKAHAAIQMVYDPYRVNYPLRRTNPKKGIGEDPKWKRISWEEAIDEIVERLGKFHEKHPEEVGFMSSPPTGADPACLFATLLGRKFGGTMLMPGPTQCANASHEPAGMNHCSWSVTPDFRYANYAIFFGAGKGISSGHSMVMLAGLRADATARGLKTVAFDPVCHQQGGKSTEWIPVLPGTDLAVALSMANVLVNELGIYDREYLERKTNAPYLVKNDGTYVRDERGEPTLWNIDENKPQPWDRPNLGNTSLEGEYEAFGEKCRPAFSFIKEHLKQYTPEWAEPISTVPATTIRRIAKEYGENARIGSTIEIDGVILPYRPVSCAIFRGGSGHSNGFHTFMAVDLLNHLVGNCEVPGGCIGWVTRSFGYPQTGMPAFGPAPSKEGFLTSSSWHRGLPATWPHPEPKLNTGVPTVASVFTLSTAEPVLVSEERENLFSKLGITSRMKALMMEGANPLMNTAGHQAMAEFLGGLEFIVHYQLYCNETSDAFADIVLPDASTLETLDILQSELYHFHYPMGMLPMEYHLRQPVVQPLHERRPIREFVLDLAERLGILPQLNEALNSYPVSTGCNPPLDPEKKYTWEEICDAFLTSKFGSEHDLEWFKDHGFIRWKKRPEEPYWKPFINARSCIYMEFLIDQEKMTKAILEPVGIELDWTQYTPLISYFDAASYKVKDTEFDLIAFSYRDVLFGGTHSQGLPWLRECAKMSPHSEMFCINIDTAKNRGIQEGDMICVENERGKKVKGKVHLVEGIHPQCVASTSHAGKWSDSQPLGKGKAPFFTALLESNFDNWCPVGLNPETSARVKLYKAEDTK